MSKLYNEAKVTKRNVLNELKSYEMTLQELRFFSIYLSKIYSGDISTRVVRFPIEDFRRIMGFGKLNLKQLKACTKNLLCKVVDIPNEKGGYRQFQLFKECSVECESDGKWYIYIDAHDKILPYMFDYKKEFFSYRLWNALRLKSTSQFRMYEILKQYESIGRRELTVEELKMLLGIEQTKYTGRTGWSNFKQKVLDECQEALAETTDICYTYERGKSGRGGKWLSIIFYIKNNPDHKDPLSLDEFIEQQSATETLPYNSPDDSEIIDNAEIDYGSDLANLLGNAALNNEFNPKQVRVIQDLVSEKIRGSDQIEKCNYLVKMVHMMNLYNVQEANRFKYLCKMIKNDNSFDMNCNDVNVKKGKYHEEEFDIEKYKEFINVIK